jgi:hypothetical protein
MLQTAYDQRALTLCPVCHVESVQSLQRCF